MGERRVFFFRRSGPKVSCRCSFLPWSGRWVGVSVCVVSRRVRVTGPRAICRVQSGALVCRRHGHGAAPCASGGGSSISHTMVHRACAVQCASAVRAVTPADAWWTHPFPRTYLGGAYPQSAFYKPTFGCTSNLLFRKSEKLSFSDVLATFSFFVKNWPRVAFHTSTDPAPCLSR